MREFWAVMATISGNVILNKGGEIYPDATPQSLFSPSVEPSVGCPVENVTTSPARSPGMAAAS